MDELPDVIWVTGQAKPWTFNYGEWHESRVAGSSEVKYIKAPLDKCNCMKRNCISCFNDNQEKES